MGIPERPAPEKYPDTTIRSVNWPAELDTVRRLFQEYRQWLSDHRDTEASASSTVSAGLAEVDRLILGLPGAYGPPHGDVVLGFVRGEPVACGALREIEPHVADLKRVYIRGDHRGPDFGKPFTRAMLIRARELGYTRVRVDTLPTMWAAMEFYPALGFRPIPAYWPHPVRGAVFFEFGGSTPTSTARPRRASRSKRRGT
jgi:GNAT superfamily N-acetyltransferase